jgi:hypothetical protein
MRLGLVLLTSFIVQGASAQMDATSAGKKAITLQYTKSDAAANKKDVNGILATLAPDYEGIDNEGRKMNRDKVKLAFNQMLNPSERATGRQTLETHRKGHKRPNMGEKGRELATTPLQNQQGGIHSGWKAVHSARKWGLEGTHELRCFRDVQPALRHSSGDFRRTACGDWLRKGRNVSP